LRGAADAGAAAFVLGAAFVLAEAFARGPRGVAAA
jgi:hypothetical protein